MKELGEKLKIDSKVREDSDRIWRIASARAKLDKMPNTVDALLNLLRMFVSSHPCPQVIFDTFEEAHKEFKDEYLLLSTIFEYELKIKNSND